MGRFALLLLLLTSPSGENNVHVPSGLLLAAADATSRASATGLEEFYCWIGSEKDGEIEVTGAVKPKQTAWVERVPTSRPHLIQVTYYNFHDDCPASTVVDFHTHPIGGTDAIGTDAGDPSQIDLRAWEAAPYRYHAIMHPHFDKYRIVFFERVGPGLFATVDKERINVR